jgi:hypothetical protein
MDNKIISKFTTATEEGVDTLLVLATAIAREKFGSITTNKVLEQYITDNFNLKTLVVEMNSMSNQWIVAYFNNKPAGYARITSKGKKPRDLEHKRIVRLADFGILKKYDDPQIALSLFDKCLSICRSYDGIWIHEYADHPLLCFFENHGFIKLHELSGQYELPLPDLYFFREKKG